ncbi:MAG TPA: hypothetical protein VKT77_05045 [Chthonomonadaceae bacterium]|nr:hypothetical protein [Chthonomonadaceae bacterium]
MQPSNSAASGSGKSSRELRMDTPNVRRRNASRAFILRVTLLMALIGGVAYIAWFSPWARPVKTLRVVSVPAGGAAHR